MRRLGEPTTQVVQFDENSKIVTQKVKFDTYTSIRQSFRQFLVLFFQNEASELQRCMKRELSSSYQDIGTVNTKRHVMS